MSMLKTNPAFVDVFVSSVIELLQKGRSVEVPGIGVLRVEHEAPTPDGKRETPRDRVVFTPKRA